MIYQVGQVLYTNRDYQFNTHTILKVTETQYVMDGCLTSPNGIQSIAKYQVEVGTNTKLENGKIYYLSRFAALNGFEDLLEIKIKTLIDRRIRAELAKVLIWVQKEIELHRENYFKKEIKRWI